MQLYSVQASTADVSVASRALSIVANGGAPTVVPLATGVSCNPLDAISLTLVDTGSDGVASAPSAAFTFTADADTTIPATPSITGVTRVS